MAKDSKGHGSDKRTTYTPGDKPGRKFKSYAEMAAYRESKETHQRTAHSAKLATEAKQKVRSTTKNGKY